MSNEEKNKDLQEKEIIDKDIDLDKINEVDEKELSSIFYKDVEDINLGEGVNEDILEDQAKTKAKETQKETPKKKNDNYKYIIYLFLILTITGLVLWYNLTSKTTDASGNPIYVYQTIGGVFANMNWGFFALFIGFIVVSYLISSFIIFMFARLYTKHYKYHQAVANNCVGAFYSAITPGASGGQFAQVYTFKKQGIPVSNSASIFVMYFIISQSVLILFGLISLATRFNLIMKVDSIPIKLGELSFNLPIWIFILFGFVINLLVIFLLLFASYSKRFLHFISVTLINWLYRFHLIKNPIEKTKSIKIQVENYRIELRRLQSNLPFTFLLILLCAINLIITQLAPFFSGLALNAFDKSHFDLWPKLYDCIVSLNFHQMITGLIPLPGSAGISEIVFSILFGPSSNFFASDFYSKGGLNIVLLVWRFGTFYIPFIVNGIVAATYKSRGLPYKERIIPVGNRKTMLTIQLETYVERKVSSDTIYETKALERKELLNKLKLGGHKEKRTKEINFESSVIDEEDNLIIGEKDEHSDIL